ncbi:S8 family peptidase [Ruminococcus sp. CLA-AA-H200]|uniref:S8 family peptidase n=1 Tax=Ruminococcus turbiniformis TaxID=2881258 RepID=A0ABS8FZ67_9FIRM|nr:S8 family peptidase [Ruminococcus turbiniformis]MCC2254919.1 S8 family peptidase [Ruminococcus turbiniformis]
MKLVKQSVGYWCEDIRARRYMGEGVCAAILDTGVSVHPDLEGRIAGFKDFTGGVQRCHDDSGHGTHVAGILAGNGKLSAGAYAGMAPRARLLVGKVLDHEGNGNVDNVLEGIDWVLSEKNRLHVRIVNISVGTQPELAEDQKKIFLEAVEELWDQGIVVVVSAGNYGPGRGTVAVPGSSRKVITVGVPDTEIPSVSKRKRRINYSGRGPTGECVIKPDIFAPGTGIMSCNARYGRSGEAPYTMKTGTSMATPVAAGAVACLLSKFPDMTNVEVKLRLRESSVKCPGTEAGWGLLNVERLLKA